MNANELADWLINGKSPDPLVRFDTKIQCAAMLRQQQAEIEVLKAEIGVFEAEKQKDFERKW